MANATPDGRESTPPTTEVLAVEDLEAMDRLLQEAEMGISAVEQLDDKKLETGRPPEEPPRRLPTIGRFGPYDIVGRLALGGMAEILLAREESEGAGGRYLVVKRILAEFEKEEAFVEMFLDEARVMMRLRHPNVCHVYKFGQQDGNHFIAMEWVSGASLGKLIRRARKSGGVPAPIACKVVALVAEALDHAHMAKGEDGSPLSIVHRDVTPDNIMISYDGSVKLLDFGIAKAELRAHKTQAGVVKGKFAYMAPEQCRAKDLDHRVDIFALGVCLYEALTGRPLYRRETEFETMEAIVRGPIPKLADRLKNPPPELEAIIAKCLAKKADDRFTTAGELQEALDQFLAKHGEVVNARRMKELMSKLFREEQARGPMVDTTPFGASFAFSSDPNAFPFSTGEGSALPESQLGDLPMPELSGLSGIEPSTTPPYQPDPGDNPSPGGAPLEPSSFGDPRGPMPSHPLSRDRRPAPTAPLRPILGPAPKQSSGAGMWIAVGVVVLGLAGGGAWFAMTQLGQDDTGPVTEGPAPILRGTLIVNSTPEGARLFVDGEERGVTPATVPELTTGSHPIRLELAGYQPHEGSVEVRASRTTSVTQPLETVALAEGPTATGRLTLTATPNARVFLAGEEVGRTPLRDLEVPAGLLRLELETADGVRHRRAVMVPADDRASTHLDLRQDP